MNTNKRLDRLEKAMKELASRLGWEITLYPSGSVYVSPKGGSNIMENIYKLDQRRIEKTKIKLSSLRLDALSDALDISTRQ